MVWITGRYCLSFLLSLSLSNESEGMLACNVEAQEILHIHHMTGAGVTWIRRQLQRKKRKEIGTYNVCNDLWKNAVQLLSICIKKRSKKKSKRAYDTRGSQAVSDPSTNRAQRCLTCQIRRDGVLSTWCGRKRKDGILATRHCFAAGLEDFHPRLWRSFRYSSNINRLVEKVWPAIFVQASMQIFHKRITHFS